MKPLTNEWIAKAEGDFTSALREYRARKAPNYDSACFHAQQCVEKYLKAMLVLHAVDFPKAHDIVELVDLLPQGVLASWAVEEQRRLTHYATVTRYPGDYVPIPLTEAKRAVRIARRVRKEIRALLPKEAVRRRRK